MDGDRVLQEMCMDPVNPKIIAVPDLEVPMIFDSLEEMAMREYIMSLGREHFKLKRCWIHLQDGMKLKI